MLLIMAILMLALLSVNVQAADTGTQNSALKKVRVGYLIYPGYQEGEGDAPKSGYGYEYLQQVAYYAGWEYEYVNGSYWIAEKNDLMVSGDLTSGYLMVIYRDVYDTDTTSSIAVIENSPFQQFCVQEHFPDAEIITCKSRQECVDAVESGKAKCTLMSSDTYYAYRDEFDNLSDLNISNTGYEVPVSLVTRRDDVQMYSFLKKGLASIRYQDIHEALIVNGYANPEMNVRQFLQKHVILVLLVLAVVIAEKISGREEAEEWSTRSKI